MSDARSDILKRLRSVLDGGRADGMEPSEIVQSRLVERPRGPQPAWSEDLLTRFNQRMESAAASVGGVADRRSLTEAVQAYLQRHQLPAQLVAAPHPLLADLSWPEPINVEHRAIDNQDLTAISVAFAGIAETGSVMMLSGAATPTRINFLPDNFLCVVARKRIVPRIEDAWELIRKEQGGMPRTVNLVTGPSRTADVEQTIQLGAHGPRRMHVLVLG